MKLILAFVFSACGTAIATPASGRTTKKALFARQVDCNTVFYSAIQCQYIEQDGGTAAEAEECVITTAEVLCAEWGYPASDCVSTLSPTVR